MVYAAWGEIHTDHYLLVAICESEDEAWQTLLQRYNQGVEADEIITLKEIKKIAYVTPYMLGSQLNIEMKHGGWEELS